MKSRMKIFDITDDSSEEAITEIRTVDSSFPFAPEERALNDFSATVLVDHFSPRLGFFFYRQEDGDPCTTTFRGLVSDDDGDAFDEVVLSSGPNAGGSFPSMLFGFTQGLGHYLEGPRFNRRHTLFPTWSEPVQTAASCVECQSQSYSLVVKGAEVVP